MKVDKRIMNSTRNALMKLQEDQKKALAKIREFHNKIPICSQNSARKVYIDKRRAEELLNDLYESDLLDEKDIIELEKEISRDEKIVLQEVKALQSIIDALSRDGLTKVTYGLPRLCITSTGASLGIPFLMMTGIKKNAQEKPEEGLTEIEAKLLEFERRLATFIDDDYGVDTRQITSFIGIYEAYIDTYYHKNGMNVVGDNFERILDWIIISTGKYIVYKKIGIEITDEVYKSFVLRYFSMLMQGAAFTRAGAIRMACDDVLKRFAGIEPEAKPVKIDVPTVIINEWDEKIECYLENGVVARRCNIDEFEGLLANSSYSVDRRNELLAQMRNFINRQNQEEYDRRIEECKSKVLSEEENALYEVAKGNQVTSGIAKDIKAIFEMMLDEVSEEDMVSLRSDLDELFSQVREILRPREEKKEESPKVVYFTEKVIDPVTGKVVDEIPKILKTLIEDKKQFYKQAYTQLTKLLSGGTLGEEIKTDGLPIRVFFKGRDYKVFYTFVGETLVIIDGLKASGDEYTKLFRTVKSDKFKSFITSVQTYVAAGNVPNALNYTKTIMDEIGKSRVKKK